MQEAVRFAPLCNSFDSSRDEERYLALALKGKIGISLAEPDNALSFDVHVLLTLLRCMVR